MSMYLLTVLALMAVLPIGSIGAEHLYFHRPEPIMLQPPLEPTGAACEGRTAAMAVASLETPPDFPNRLHIADNSAYLKANS
jgi:hypothetical protein